MTISENTKFLGSGSYNCEMNDSSGALDILRKIYNNKVNFEDRFYWVVDLFTSDKLKNLLYKRSLDLAAICLNQFIAI